MISYIRFIKLPIAASPTSSMLAWLDGVYLAILRIWSYGFPMGFVILVSSQKANKAWLETRKRAMTTIYSVRSI
jgi:hypothetical protein